MENAFITEFNKVTEEIRELFAAKNSGYNTDNNPLLNFSIGGRLLTGREDMVGCFEALKAYMTKHVSNVYCHTIMAPNLEESMKDIATYMIIGTVMARLTQKTPYPESNASTQIIEPSEEPTEPSKEPIEEITVE